MTTATSHTPRLVPQVTVSSTFNDLKVHRAALIKCIKAQKLTDVAMENDAAKLVDIIDSSLQMVRDGSAYVGIISLKYGQRPSCPRRNPEELSITELEFNEAVRLKRPILLFIMGNDHQGRREDFESDPVKLAKLDAFRERAKRMYPDSATHRVYAEFNNLREFEHKIYPSIAELCRHFDTQVESLTEPVTSNLQASTELAIRIEDLSQELVTQSLVGRAAELMKLDSFLQRPNGFLLVTGDAGYGKSALLAHWLSEQPADRLVIRHIFSFRSDLTRSVLEFYCSTLIKLSVHWKRQLLTLPVSETDARDALFALFQEVRSTGQSKASPVVIVVDGLDEAAPTARWDYPFFPKLLPEGLHIVASVRLAENDQVPAYLREWLAQCDQRLPVGVLDRSALVEWIQKFSGPLSLIADEEAIVDELVRKTCGLPLHIAFIFEDLSKLLPSVENFARLIECSPSGFVGYVDLQFQKLVESSVGKERRWRDFFGLLVVSKAELQREDINTILGLTIWNLYEMPPELHRWVAQRDDRYVFRHEALRLAFRRVDPWPEASEHLLNYSKEWKTHKRPYAFRSLVGHLRDMGDKRGWFETASDLTFLRLQGQAFPYEPLLPLQTIEEAMTEAIDGKDIQPLCRLMFVHALWMPDPLEINPVECALTNLPLARQRIKLAKLTDPSTEIMWQVLVAWRCAVDGNVEEAKRFLLQTTNTTHRPVHVVFWGQILGLVLPKLLEIDFTQGLKIARTLINTPELPRILGLVCPPTRAIELTQKWYKSSRQDNASGWLALWRSLAMKGAIVVIFEAIRNRSPDQRAYALLEASIVFAELGKLDQIEACLVEVETLTTPMSDISVLIQKSQIVILALVGLVRFREGAPDGKKMLLIAKQRAETMPPNLPYKAETLALVGVACAQANATEEAISVFEKAVELAGASSVPTWLRVGTLQDVGRHLWPALPWCPALHDICLSLLESMEQLAEGSSLNEQVSNFFRTIANGWDELEEVEKAFIWLRQIPKSSVSREDTRRLCCAKVAYK
jgi:hypothetical protein